VAETTVSAYLKELASSKAVPGGGSAAAVAAAMGSALLSMVSKISARKLADVGERQKLEGLASTLEGMAAELLRLGQDDIDAYRAVLEARKSSEASPDRDRLISQAVERAARVPLETARHASVALGIEEQIRPRAWEMIRSDLETGHHLLLTGLRGALLNVAANLPDLQAAARLELEKGLKELNERHAV
jgi:formiminotetrahydrofolate cyclodeaminase